MLVEVLPLSNESFRVSIYLERVYKMFRFEIVLI